MKYVVGTFRAAGLEAKWTRTRNGTPIIACRYPDGLKHQREKWWVVDEQMFHDMERHGILEGFKNATFLGDFFSFAA